MVEVDAQIIALKKKKECNQGQSRGGRGGAIAPLTSPKKILYSIAIYNTCHFDLKPVKRSILKEQITLFCLCPIGSFVFINKTMFVGPI